MMMILLVLVIMTLSVARVNAVEQGRSLRVSTYGPEADRGVILWTKIPDGDGVSLPEYPSDLELARAEADGRLQRVSQRFRATVDEMRRSTDDRLDIVFLIDASASVGRVNFGAELRFVRKLLADFDVNVNQTRVALVTFSSRRQVVRHVDQISAPSPAQDKCSLLQDQLPAVGYSGGGTYTYGALAEAEQIFRVAPDPRSPVIFLVTDGYSNGRSPLPVAKRLRKAGVRIFAIGIETGNDEELARIVTSPAHLYLVASFEQFEQLARQALHHDYRAGGPAVPVANRTLCNRLCDSAADGCCDDGAVCGCSTSSGHYRCSCGPGYAGSGLRGECHPCANGTFWSGAAGLCEQCPYARQITRRLGALSVRECVCPVGYQQDEDGRCVAVTCTELQPPPNGYFVMEPKPCGRVLNAACGVRCRPGYELTGTSIRLCQENGTWSGTETKCTLKECPRLSIPYYGMAVCTNVDLDLHYDYTPRNKTFMANYGGQTTERFTEAMPIDTECSFKCGPGFYLKGSHTRNCLPLSKWDGLQTQCKQILCPALPAIPYAKYEPTDCAVSKSAFGTNCTLMCDFGFEMQGGPSTKQCGGRRTGVWSNGRGSKTPRCLDVAPPYMECPGHYSVLMDDTYPYALVRRLQQPYVYDNSGDNYTYWSRPAIPESGLHLALGDHRFTYVAVDAFKNRARCSFTVTVLDQTPPEFDACSDPPVHYVSLANNPQETFVHWDDPHVADNSGVEGLTLTKNLTQGYLPAGVHYVRYRALDPTANVAECTMRVEVRQYSCDIVPDLGPHGVAVCAHNGTHVWCELSCKDDYMFHNQTADTVTLVCERDRPTWGEPGSVPECSRVVSPVGVQKVLTVRLTEELPPAACNPDSEELGALSETFSEGLHEQLCGDQPDCNLLTSLPACSGGVDVDVADNATRYHVVERRRRRVGTGESRSAVKVVVYQRISQKLGLWRSDGKKSENIKRIKEELQKINGNEKLRRRLGALKLDLSVLKLDELIHCPAGSITRNLLCVQCPRGTYHNRTAAAAAAGCVPCPAGTFNERPGQAECQACPPFHGTARPHAKHAHDCKAQCGPGTVARWRAIKLRRPGATEEPRFQKTLMPFCRKCDAGHYQPHHHRLECVACPAGYTSRRGARTPDDCFPLQAPGGDGERDGQELAGLLNPCGSAPCLNGGTCVGTGSEFECRCRGAWVGGRHCELYVDPCASPAAAAAEGHCGVGGTCVEVDGQPVCECAAGYEGERCERRHDYCAPNPCQSAGVCEEGAADGAEGYRCRCPAGKVGRRCHLEPCDYEPCGRGGGGGGRARCLNGGGPGGGGGFRCVCPGGWRGAPNCTEVDDPCEAVRFAGWCQHGGRCVPLRLRKEGDGEEDGEEEDEAVYGEVRCECPADRGGDRCERPVSIDFLLDFPGGGGGDSFVRLPLGSAAAGGWEAVGVCGWFATGDTDNYGTLVSYATPPATDNALTLTDPAGLVVYVNGRHVVTGVALNDGEWHFVCVSWASAGGRWAVYLDGVLGAHGVELAAGAVLAGGGQLVLGQDQDGGVAGGGFSETEAYRGRMAYVAVWARELSGPEVAGWYGDVCTDGAAAAAEDLLLLRWSDVQRQRGAVGRAVRISPSGFCGRCAHNLTLAHGSVTYGGGGEAGERAVFRCDKGYEMSGGGDEARCLPTSHWTLERPTCKLVRCETLGSPLNGRAVLSTGSGGGTAIYGAVVRFTCDTGFLLVGDPERHCRASGTWSGGPDPPVCRSVDRCSPLPPTEPHWLGTVVYADDRGVLRTPQSTYDVGVLAEMRCADGWAPETGDELLICRDGGHWDPPAPLHPRCIPRVHIWPLPSTTPRVIRVSRRPDVPFWMHLRDYLLHGCRGTAGADVLVLFCFDWTGPNASPSTELPTWRDLTDYQLPVTSDAEDGKPTAEPLAEQLLHRLLATAADGGPDPALRPPQLLPYILYGVREPPAESRLAADAEDAYRFLVCQYIGIIMMDRELNYDGELEVEVDGNGNTNARIKLLLRNVVRPIYQLYRQRQGLLSDGARESTRTTTPDPGLRCELAALPPPPIDARVLAPPGSGEDDGDGGDWLRGNRSTVAAGTRVRYGCARGFSMHGPGETRCAATGHWTPVHGFCQGALCDEPRLRPLMILADSSASGPPQQHYFVDDELEIRCREGHVLQGHPSIRCQPNGRWTPIVAHCARVSCGPAPVRRTDPSFAGKTYHYGDSLQLGCGGGRSVDTTCQANGQWTPFTEC